MFERMSRNLKVQNPQKNLQLRKLFTHTIIPIMLRYANLANACSANNFLYLGTLTLLLSLSEQMIRKVR